MSPPKSSRSTAKPGSGTKAGAKPAAKAAAKPATRPAAKSATKSAAGSASQPVSGAEALSPEPAARPNRNDLRRARTRAALMSAALRLMGERGIDAVTIAEIATEADVAFGSFYNHFESKDALVEALIIDLLAGMSDVIDAATADIEDPLLGLAVAFRILHRTAEDDPALTAFILRAAFSDDRVLTGILGRVRRDVDRAVAAGRIVLPDADLAVLMLGGASLLATRGVIDGRLPTGRDSVIAELLLRLLGVAPGEAAALASAPLPNWRRTPSA